MMQNRHNPFNYLLLFFPFLLSLAVKDYPGLSYWIAWGGSFWVFYFSLTGKIKPLPKDLSFAQQFMRPIILTQIIFAGYMAVTSVFHFLDAQGFHYFDKEYQSENREYFELLAECQRYYCLSHAAFTSGILLFMNYSFHRVYLSRPQNTSTRMLLLSIVFSVSALTTKMLPGLDQFYVKLGNLSLVASVISLAFSIPQGKFKIIILPIVLFLMNLINALLSGWKESVIVLILMLGVFVYPIYKKTVTFIFPIVFLGLFTFLPSYVKIIRQLSWNDEEKASSAAQEAIDKLQNNEVDLKESNWEFLTDRFSEIGMFVKYVKKVPSEREFYGLELLSQAIMALVPKVVYREKPPLEEVVMQRVYEAGVASEESLISAKPPLVTDGYLSGGVIGVFLASLIVGSLTSITSVTAEKLFGGYLLGSGLIYTGLFQIFWRGNCFEFMLGSIFWSWVIMVLLFQVARKFGFILKLKTDSIAKGWN